MDSYVTCATLFTADVSKAPSDLDLISTMMKRIAQLETQTTRFSKDVVEKDKKIKVLWGKTAEGFVVMLF